MIPSKLNPLGIDQNYPLMKFEKDGNLVNIDAMRNEALIYDGNGIYNIGWRESGFRQSLWFPVSIKAGEDVSISFEVLSTTASIRLLFIQFRATDQSYTSFDFLSPSAGQKYNNFTPSKDMEAIRIAFSNSGEAVGSSTTFKDFMIKKGTASAYPSYEPYNPNTYCVYGQSSQETRSLSANLFNGTLENGTLNITTGAEETSDNYQRSGYITAKPSTAYTLQKENVGAAYWGMYAYDSNKNYIDRSQHNVADSIVWTTPANTAYLRFRIYKTEVSKVMLSINSSKATYQPFVPNAPSPSPQYPSPIISNYPKGVYKTNLGFYIRLYDDLRGIGSYRDKITYNKATGDKVLSKRIRRYLPKASDAIQVSQSIQWCPYLPGANTPPNDISFVLAMSNYYKGTARYVMTPGDNWLTGAAQDYVRINDNRFTTVSEFKNYLTAQQTAGNPVIVDYVLATSITQYL